ncbi:MAG: hypothetical protein K4304_02410 [Propionicimonas sp.]
MIDVCGRLRLQCCWRRDLKLGAKDLKLVVTAMREHDEARAARLRDFAKKMSVPGPYDAWD